MKERTRLEHSINLCNDVSAELNDNIELIELGEMENDLSIVEDAENALSKLTEKAQQEKWRQEEEELEKVRKAREILREAKASGCS